MVLSDSLAGTLQAFPSPELILWAVFGLVSVVSLVSLWVVSRGRRP